MKVSPLLIASALLIGLSGSAFAYPVRVAPCEFPHGWNSTDASRAIRGVPPGRDHRCIVGYGRYRPGWGWRREY